MKVHKTSVDLLNSFSATLRARHSKNWTRCDKAWIELYRLSEDGDYEGDASEEDLQQPLAEGVKFVRFNGSLPYGQCECCPHDDVLTISDLCDALATHEEAERSQSGFTDPDHCFLEDLDIQADPENAETALVTYSWGS